MSTAQTIQKPLTSFDFNLTKDQAIVFEYILAYWTAEDRFPTTRRIQEALEFNSQTLAIYYLEKLERRGVIEKRSAPGMRSWWRFKPAVKRALITQAKVTFS